MSLDRTQHKLPPLHKENQCVKLGADIWHFSLYSSQILFAGFLLLSVAMVLLSGIDLYFFYYHGMTKSRKTCLRCATVHYVDPSLIQGFKKHLAW